MTQVRVPRVLRHADFRNLWIGQSLSLVGDGVFFVAIAWLALSFAQGPQALAVVILAWLGGFLGMSPLAGQLADHRPRRSLLIAADLLRAGALTSMGVVAATGHAGLLPIALLSIAHGAGDGLFAPTFLGTVATLVPPEDLVAANALEHVARPICYRLVGPTLGGLIVAVGSPGLALMLDGATFLACALLMLRLPPMRATPSAQLAGEGWRPGLSYAAGQPWLIAGMVAGAATNIVFWGSIEVFIPTRLHDDLGGSSVAYGALLASNGLGSLAAAAVLLRRPGTAPRLWHAFGCWALAAIAVSAYALSSEPWEMLLPAFAFGAGMAAGVALWNATIQRQVPDDVIGRVGALDGAISQSMTPLAMIAAGPVIAVAGTRGALAGGGLFALLVLTLSYLLIARRHAAPWPTLLPDQGRDART